MGPAGVLPTGAIYVDGNTIHAVQDASLPAAGWIRERPENSNRRQYLSRADRAAQPPVLQRAAAVGCAPALFETMVSGETIQITSA
jgi:hypothetical protein